MKILLSGRRYARSAERLTFRSQARRIVRIFAVALPDGNPSGNGNGAGGKTEGDVSATEPNQASVFKGFKALFTGRLY